MNHFIEVGEDRFGSQYLVIHTGSRNLGTQVAKFYQEIAIENSFDRKREFQERKKILIEEYKDAGMHQYIQRMIENLEPAEPLVDKKELAFLDLSDRENYLHDMKVTQRFATANRDKIADKILEYLEEYEGIVEMASFETIHNYIGDDNIVRKGAISAYKGQKVLIPLNMRDGSIIAIGEGNEDWNYSAPHGAGRLMSRSAAEKTISLEDFEKTMEGIYTSSVSETTIDESPFAYKDMQEILDAIEDTVEVLDIIKPIYNFKAHRPEDVDMSLLFECN